MRRATPPQVWGNRCLALGSFGFSVHPASPRSRSLFLPHQPPPPRLPPGLSSQLRPPPATLPSGAPSAGVVVLLQGEPPLAHAPLHSLPHSGPFPGHPGPPRVREQQCLPTAVWGVAGHPTLQTHRHKQPTHALTVSLRPQRTLTPTHTRILTRERSTDTSRDAHTQTPRLPHPDPDRLPADPRPGPRGHSGGGHGGRTPGTPTTHGDTDAQTDTGRCQWLATRTQVPDKANNPAGPRCPGTPPAAAPSPAPPRPHSPSWERLAQPGAPQQAHSRSRARAEGAPIALAAGSPLGAGGRVPGGGHGAGGQRRRPEGAQEPLQPRGRGWTERELALLQSRGLNRTLGANHSGGGGWRGAGLGAGGYRLQQSPLPLPPTPLPRRGGVSCPLPGELRQPGSGVEPREGAGSATDPRAPLLGSGWREGVGMALGQLAGAATAGLDQGVPTSPRPSSPSLFSLATEIPKSPGGPPSTVHPGTASHWVASYLDLPLNTNIPSSSHPKAPS